MDCLTKYKLWCDKAKDKKILEELAAIKGDSKEIEERFGGELAFGTAGLRGVMGAGTTRMNIYTVARVTEGLALFMREKGGRSVVISFDTRNNSCLFAHAARQVLEHFDIKTYIFETPHPVPLLSFAVRQLEADFGIMITASHNPKEYNGYKLYNHFGAQLADQDSDEMAKYIDKASLFAEYKEASEPNFVDSQIDLEYGKTMGRHFAGLRVQSDTEIVYTSIHGSGLHPVKALFEDFGLKYSVVESQADFNGDFPTVSSPNPENREALSLAVEQAKKCGGQAVIATDPDADRMAAAVKNKKGDFVYLDGNQTGVLLIDFLLSACKPQKGMILKSFVSTNMADGIAKDCGVRCFEVGVGFKNIAQKMQKFDRDMTILGFEESCGYLLHPYCQDKDGVSAALVFALMTAHYNRLGKSVLDRLEELYVRHGFFIDKSISAYYEGLEGFKTMQKIMDRIFEKTPDAVGGKKVVRARDYQAEHNSVYYELEGGSFVCVRPSGTEPKLKYYIGATASTKSEAEKVFCDIQRDMECLTK